jgi:GDP-D-mannose dehydratase
MYTGLAYPDNFALGTRVSHTVIDVQAALKEIQIELKWIVNGLYNVEIFYDETLDKVNEIFYKPLEPHNYQANHSKVE